VDRASCEAADRDDPLAVHRDRFALPDGVIYLDGNSLGAQQHVVRQRVAQVLSPEWSDGLIRSWNAAGWVDLPARIAARRALPRATAERLNREHFGGRLRWASIRFVSNQRDRYGSCTPEDGSIRISHRVAEYPSWVREYVVMHELAHLEVPSHSPRFWRLVERYPLAERARGFLIAKGWED
jgi:hypothetical protein